MIASDVPADRRDRGEAAPTGGLLAAVVALVVAAGVGLRFWATSPLWLDEALTVNISRLAPADALAWLAHDGAPPLWYLMLGGWVRVFGHGDLAARSLSGVVGAITLLVAWRAALRVAGRQVALVALLLLALNPFAIRFSTEARMYSLVIALVFAGIAATHRAWEAPTLPTLALVAALTAALLYSHYWSLFLIAAVAAGLVVLVVRRAEVRPQARGLLAALVVGVATFIPWVPTLVEQVRHTGTPWGHAVSPFVAVIGALADFTGFGHAEGWLLFLGSSVLVGIALWRRRQGALPVLSADIVVGAVAFVLGAVVSWAGGQAFQARYGAIVFPMWLLAVALGVCALATPMTRVAVMAALLALGAIGGVRVALAERTQAAEVAAVLVARAGPGDAVVYCPDQLGVAVHRVVERRNGSLGTELAVPAGGEPGVLVDWKDYEDRIARTDPRAVARAALRAAPEGSVWLVTASGYRTHEAACPALERALGERRRPRRWLEERTDLQEKAALVEFAP